ncbi:MAG: PD-(D/E)XK nuclease family protein [Elusimicrobiaceae bacterium]|nr:PD-(D/E)XK nuclease family protein [Elusimicrobiaceae bacterium]
MTKNLSFSYSKMGMYKECPQKYKFRYVHLIPELPKYYFAFGSALHSVMEFIYDPARSGFPTLAQALAYFDKIWNKTTYEQKGYASVEKELAGYAEGRHEIESYYAKHAATFVKPLSVEMKSTLEIDGLSLISILDRMDYLGGGKIKILDYKTGKTVQREPDQLYMYQKVAETSPTIKALVQQQDPGVKKVRVEQLSFYHLPSLTEMTFERAPDKEIVQFWRGVLDVADQIRAGHFAPTPGENQCRWCDYRNICPVYTGREYTGPSGAAALPYLKEGLPAAAQPTSAPEHAIKSEAEILSEKIDRLGSLEKEQKTLRKEIVELMHKQQFVRHFSTHYQAHLTPTQKTTFADKQKVLELLRKHQLLNKTLVPTQTTILALLKDPQVSQEVKDQLTQLLSVQSGEELTLEETD